MVFELAGGEVGVGNGERGFETANEVGQGEGVEQAGAEEALVGSGVDVGAGYGVEDFEDAGAFVHGGPFW